MPRTRRSFPPEFKAQVVLEILTGNANLAETCRKHNLKPQLVTSWKTTVLEHLADLFGERGPDDPVQARIAELEQLVGRQALELEILKKASRMLPGPTSRNGRLP
jgi:transposase